MIAVSDFDPRFGIGQSEIVNVDVDEFANTHTCCKECSNHRLVSQTQRFELLGVSITLSMSSMDKILGIDLIFRGPRISRIGSLLEDPKTVGPFVEKT